MRRAWVDIDLGALRQNARTMAARAGRPILPMVKADAYGLGAVAVARALEPLDLWGFGIAAVSEGEVLRAAGIRRPTHRHGCLRPRKLATCTMADATRSRCDPSSLEAP